MVQGLPRLLFWSLIISPLLVGAIQFKILVQGNDHGREMRFLFVFSPFLIFVISSSPVFSLGNMGKGIHRVLDCFLFHIHVLGWWWWWPGGRTLLAGIKGIHRTALSSASSSIPLCFWDICIARKQQTNITVYLAYDVGPTYIPTHLPTLNRHCVCLICTMHSPTPITTRMTPWYRAEDIMLRSTMA